MFNYNVMVKSVAQAANRALGLLMSKVKLNSGVHNKCFTQMLDTFVWPVIRYSACIWGTRKYGAIESVFNGACRFFLGSGQHAPVSAVREWGGGGGGGGAWGWYHRYAGK